MSVIQNSLIFLLAIAVIFSFNNCTEKPLDKSSLSSQAPLPTPNIAGVSTVNVEQDLVTVQGSNLDKVTSIGIKGGDKTVGLSIQTKSANMLVAKASSALELAAGIYNLIINRANAETIAPIQVTVASSPKFTSIDKALLGGLPTVGGTTKVFSLPSSVPANAKEVLVYAFVGSGSVGTTNTAHMQISTQEGSTKYHNLLFLHTYSQNAISYNSSNMWLPVTSNRQVAATLTDTNVSFGDNLYGWAYVIGYR